MRRVRESIPQPTQGTVQGGARSQGGGLAGAALPGRIHLLGAGGAGLSGAGRMLSALGHRITGHDREASPFTAALGEAGVQIGFGPSAAEHLPGAY